MKAGENEISMTAGDPVGGTTVGADVSSTLGDSVGNDVGCVSGQVGISLDGLCVFGAFVGFLLLGLFIVGQTVGAGVQTCPVGIGVKTVVGVRDGLNVGRIVGENVGFLIGMPVGKPVGCSESIIAGE